MLAQACLPILMLLAPLPAPRPAQAEAVWTRFSILVGFPEGTTSGQSGALLVPGTVIPISGAEEPEPADTQQRMLEDSRRFTRVVDKLWQTFRLDPSRQPQRGIYVLCQPGKPVELPKLESGDIDIEATLRDFDRETARYRVVVRQGGKQISDSALSVQRGGRAVLGAMDGAAAPYIFVIAEPDPPDEEGTAPMRIQKGSGLTAPAVVKKIDPRYPEGARKDKVSGVVILDVIVGTDGRVTQIRSLESPDPRLSDAAIEAVRQWEFEPARLSSGKNVPVRCTITVRFALR